MIYFEEKKVGRFGKKWGRFDKKWGHFDLLPTRPYRLCVKFNSCHLFYNVGMYCKIHISPINLIKIRFPHLLPHSLFLCHFWRSNNIP